MKCINAVGLVLSSISTAISPQCVEAAAVANSLRKRVLTVTSLQSANPDTLQVKIFAMNDITAVVAQPYSAELCVPERDTQLFEITKYINHVLIQTRLNSQRY